MYLQVPQKLFAAAANADLHGGPVRSARPIAQLPALLVQLCAKTATNAEAAAAGG